MFWFFGNLFEALGIASIRSIGGSLLVRGAQELGLIDPKDRSTPRALRFLANASAIGGAAKALRAASRASFPSRAATL